MLIIHLYLGVLVPGTATGGPDFTSLTSQTVSFAAAQTTSTCTVTIIDDNKRELQEAFTVTLATTGKGNLLTSTAFVTINDNDDSKYGATVALQ